MKKVLLFLFLILPFDFFGQEFTPIVTQFTKKDYNASNQNWSVGQGKDGAMYFGNKDGLLQFDGSLWNIYKIPGKKIVRSLFVDKDNKIYVGSFEEFGYFEKNENGQLRYTSLSSKLKKYVMQNDEIWNILNFNGTIIFQSFNSYFIFSGGRVRGCKSSLTFLFFNNYRNKIFTNTDQYGFSYFDDIKQIFAPVPACPLKSPVISVLPFDQTHALIVTKSEGLFLYDGYNFMHFVTEADAQLKKSEINRAVISPNGLIILGTVLNGVTAINNIGQKLWTLNMSNVLQNNTVLGMYCDRDNDLWLTLNKGIALVQLNSYLSSIHSFNPSIGSVYSLSNDARNLYIGTNQGLYKAVLNPNKKCIQNIKRESGIKGQVWSLNHFGKQQFCGNNDQTYDVSSGKSLLMSPVKGGMCMKEGVIHGKDVLVQGTYTKLCIYEKKKGMWVFSHTLDGFVNPIRYIEIDYTGTIWASHSHQGLYAIQLTPDLKKIDHITTYKSLDRKHKNPINIFSINNRVVFTDSTAFYTFDDIKKKIVLYDELNKNLGNFSRSYKVCHFKSNLYWFIHDGEAALVQINARNIKFLDVVQYGLFLNQAVEDYQNVIPISDSECLFTLENGLALYRIDSLYRRQSDTLLQMKYIQTVDAKLKKVAFLPLISESRPKTPYSRNNIIFTVAYPRYTHLKNICFRYKLIGFDKAWSVPTASSCKEYRSLSYGKYKLMVEVMTISGIRLSQVSYSFEVIPPFYWSPIAKILYFILLILLIYGYRMYIPRLSQIKKEKSRIRKEEIRKKEVEKEVQQSIAIENTKLESILSEKSKELAASALAIIKKNEILIRIKEEVIAQKKALGSQYPNKYYDRLIRLVDENLSTEDDWIAFQSNYDQVHENFFQNLHKKYPDLTANDLRLCAYLRLNLSNKDIAHLMNISTKGVEVGRYRIRKKLGLPSDKNLTEFMIEFK